MRFLLLAMMVFGDLVFVAATVYCLLLAPTNLLVWFIVILAWRSWYQVGGWSDYRLTNLRLFLTHAREYGL